jgi:hypothetical protein
MARWVFVPFWFFGFGIWAFGINIRIGPVSGFALIFFLFACLAFGWVSAGFVGVFYTSTWTGALHTLSHFSLLIKDLVSIW